MKNPKFFTNTTAVDERYKEFRPAEVILQGVILMQVGGFQVDRFKCEY